VSFKWLFFVCLIVVLTITDLRVRILPDAINFPGFIAGVIFSFFVPPGDGTATLLNVRLFHNALPESTLGILDALLGAAFGSLLLWGAATLYKLVRGREGMGFGDVKMMAMVGAFVGLRGSFMTILLGTLLGSILGLALIIALYAIGWKRRLAERASRRGLGKVASLRWAIASQYQLPLGTFLGIGALVVVFVFSSPIINLAPRTVMTP
jgi:leader peptidase (prepilin peptidase)/N-methyltransferase